MTPPTGLTLIIHVLIIVCKKVAEMLHLPFPKFTSREGHSFSGEISSLVIIFTIGVFIVFTVFGFFYRAVMDERATWRVASQVVGQVQYAIKGTTPQQVGENILVRIDSIKEGLFTQRIKETDLTPKQFLIIINLNEALADIKEKIFPQKKYHGPNDDFVATLTDRAFFSLTALAGPHT